MDGGSGSDFIDASSSTGQNILQGGSGIDQLYGGMGDHVLNGGTDNDYMESGNGNDTVFGGSGDDVMNGGIGFDHMEGGDGNDTLTGVRSFGIVNPGKGEIDELIGDIGFNNPSGKDTFVLGQVANDAASGFKNVERVFYNDGNDLSRGLNDYALIKDFNRSGVADKIQLAGRAGDYVLSTGHFSSTIGTDTGIFRKTGTSTELIGVVQGVTGLNLNSSSFGFVHV